MTPLPFQVAMGSVPGARHRHSLRNNQDGAAVVTTPVGLVAAVCDGCGSAPQSEVGARLLAHFLANQGSRMLLDVGRWGPPGAAHARVRAALMETLRLRALGYLGGCAAGLGGNPVHNIQALFLCTALVAVVTPAVTWVSTIGDGVVALNGKVQIIDEDNTPVYLAYGLVADARRRLGPRRLRFVERGALPTGELCSLQVASDGAADLLRRAGEPLRDGSSPGGLEQFGQPGDVGRRNAVQRRLVVVGVRNGRARDDTTVVCIERKGGGAGGADG